MKTLLVATKNQGKVKEIESRIERLGFSVKSLHDIEKKIEIIEDANTFEGNAIKKAVSASLATGCPTLADDSGLEVDALDGEPGVHSARYGGPGLDDRERCQLLIQNLEGIPREKRSARFHAVLAYLESPSKTPLVFHGTLEGWISFKAAGTHGFGYDPVFVPNTHTQSLAILGPDVKRKISHRALALGQFIEYLKE